MGTASPTPLQPGVLGLHGKKKGRLIKKENQEDEKSESSKKVA